MGTEQHFSLTVGAIGWEQDCCGDRFYPHDLPREWRLAYYANEFSVVLVPDAYWFKAALPDTRQWLDDVPKEFRFYIQVTQRMFEAQQWHDVVFRVKELKPSLGGWVLELPAEITELVKKQLCRIQPQTSVVSLNNSISGTPSCWRTDKAAVCGAIGVADFTRRPTLRQLRAVIEDFINHSSGECRALFLDATFATVADAKTISRLLGF